MLRRSKECVINLPTLDLVDTVVGIGNCHGADVDKFQRFGLTPKRAAKVAAPLIAECYANFKCRLRDTRMIRTYGLFIWEVVKAHVAVSPNRPFTKPLLCKAHSQIPQVGRFAVTSSTSWARSHRIVDASEELPST